MLQLATCAMSGLSFEQVSRTERTFSQGKNYFTTASLQILVFKSAAVCLSTVSAPYPFAIRSLMYIASFYLPYSVSSMISDDSTPEIFKTTIRLIHEYGGPIIKIAYYVGIVAMCFFGHHTQGITLLTIAIINLIEDNGYLPTLASSCIRHLSALGMIVIDLALGNYVDLATSAINIAAVAEHRFRHFFSTKIPNIDDIPHHGLSHCYDQERLVPLGVSTDHFLYSPINTALNAVEHKDPQLLMKFTRIFFKDVKPNRVLKARMTDYCKSSSLEQITDDSEIIKFFEAGIATFIANVKNMRADSGNSTSAVQLEQFTSIIIKHLEDNIEDPLKRIELEDILYRIVFEAGPFCLAGKVRVCEGIVEEITAGSRSETVKGDIIKELYAFRDRFFKDLTRESGERVVQAAGNRGRSVLQDIHVSNHQKAAFGDAFGLYTDAAKADETTEVNITLLTLNYINRLLLEKIFKFYYTPDTIVNQIYNLQNDCRNNIYNKMLAHLKSMCINAPDLQEGDSQKMLDDLKEEHKFKGFEIYDEDLNLPKELVRMILIDMGIIAPLSDTLTISDRLFAFFGS